MPAVPNGGGGGQAPTASGANASIRGESTAPNAELQTEGEQQQGSPEPETTGQQESPATE